MLSEDIFRSRLEATVASLSYWAPTIKNAAQVKVRDEVSQWRMTVTPHLRTACAFELCIRSDQTYDVTIGGETYRRLPIETFERFVPMAEAIAEGRVLQRTWVTSATEAEHTVETIIKLQGGSEWRDARVNQQIARLVDRDECIRIDRTFPPYHRI